MSYDRNIKWLNDRRVIYRREPVYDIPTIETDQYMFYENGTYQHYHLFNSKAKITTYRSLKWHMLVIYHLNKDNKYSLSPFFVDRLDLEATIRALDKAENKFEKMHEILYENQKAQFPEDLKKYARQSGIKNKKKFEKGGNEGRWNRNNPSHNPRDEY